MTSELQRNAVIMAMERIAAIASDYGEGQRMSAADVAEILAIARAVLSDLTQAPITSRDRDDVR